MNKRRVGSDKEQLAYDYLTSNGIVVIERNYRCKIGEIDLIGKDKDTYVFFEVKYRASIEKGQASEAVNFRKQEKISRVCDYYRMINRLNDLTPCRFDVIAIDGEKIDWIKNAFEYIFRKGY